MKKFYEIFEFTFENCWNFFHWFRLWRFLVLEWIGNQERIFVSVIFERIFLEVSPRFTCSCSRNLRCFHSRRDRCCWDFHSFVCHRRYLHDSQTRIYYSFPHLRHAKKSTRKFHFFVIFISDLIILGSLDEDYSIIYIRLVSITTLQLNTIDS